MIGLSLCRIAHSLQLFSSQSTASLPPASSVRVSWSTASARQFPQPTPSRRVFSSSAALALLAPDGDFSFSADPFFVVDGNLDGFFPPWFGTLRGARICVSIRNIFHLLEQPLGCPSFLMVHDQCPLKHPLRRLLRVIVNEQIATCPRDCKAVLTPENLSGGGIFTCDEQVANSLNRLPLRKSAALRGVTGMGEMTVFLSSGPAGPSQQSLLNHTLGSSMVYVANRPSKTRTAKENKLLSQNGPMLRAHYGSSACPIQMKSCNPVPA